MKAYIISGPQNLGADNLKLMDIPTPNATDDLVLVQTEAVGLNPVDYKLADDGNQNWHYPHVLGVDVAGIIVACGKNAKTSLRVGDRVCGHANLEENGTFGEYVLMHDYSLALIPETVTFEQAASILCGGMSAFQALYRKANLTGKSTILIHGGAGGVGSVAIQLAKRLGLTVITTVSSKKIEFVKIAGADHIIDYQTENVTEHVLKLTNGQGVDISINSISNEEIMQDILNRLAYNGQVISLTNSPFNVNMLDLAEKGLTISALNLGGAHRFHTLSEKADLTTMAQELVQMIANNELDPMIGKIISFDNLVDGLSALKASQVTGKIVVKLS